jgi:CheY-like chemotaxis protein
LVAPPLPRDTDRDLAAALHEVGNALTVMLGWLEAADESARTESLRDAAEAIGVALSRARRAHRIARRAIELPGPADGADASATTGERLGMLIDEARRGLLHEAKRAGVVLTQHVPEDAAGVVVGSGDRLLQIVTNLVLNAIAVTPSGREVRIEASAPDGAGAPSAVVAVVDGGPGIPSGERTRLFQRGASGRVGGAGIGLAHAQAIALEEGGSLSLAPFEAGCGARFELAWPLHEGAPVTAPRTLRPARLDGVRVAVLEDDAAIVELLETVLVARGAEVVAVPSLATLRSALGASRVDVALVDASPLGASLEATLDDLKRDFPNTDLVLISGSPDPGASAERLSVTWIRKPFEVSEVVEVLRLVKR